MRVALAADEAGDKGLELFRSFLQMDVRNTRVCDKFRRRRDVTGPQLLPRAALRREQEFAAAAAAGHHTEDPALFVQSGEV